MQLNGRLQFWFDLDVWNIQKVLFQKVFLEPNRPPLETLSKMQSDYDFVFLEGFGYTKNFLGPNLIMLKNAI